MKFIIFCLTIVNFALFAVQAPVWVVSAFCCALGIHWLKLSEEEENEN